MQKSRLLGSGLAGLAVQNIGQIADSAVTATGSTQADAYAIKADVTEVTTTASSTGVILPASAAPGDFFWIYNIGAQTLSVYPPVGQSINAVAANGAYSQATAKVGYYQMVSATRWAAGLLA